MSLNRLAFRSLRARPLRATLSALGVALGVAVLFAGLATNAGVETSVQGTVRDLVGRADLRVAAFGETGLSPETVAAIATTPGVDVAAPALEQRTYLGTGLASGDALPPPVTVLGIDPTVDGRLHDLAIVDGSPLLDPTEHSALITERLATQDGLTVGSPLTMEGAGAAVSYRVVGIVRGDGPLTGAFGRTVVVPLRTAQEVFGETGVTRVDIGLTGYANLAAVSAALESRLVTQPYVLSSPQDLAATLRSSTTDFQATTALIAAIALFAGAFLIFNTLSMTVDRAHPRSRAAACRRRGPWPGHVVHAHPGPRPRRHRFAAGSASSGSSSPSPWSRSCGRSGSVTLERPAMPLDAIVVALVGRHRRHPRRRPRAGAPCQPHPAGRGAQGPTRPAGGAQRASPLAGGRIRRGRPRRGRHPAAVPGAAALSRRSPCTRSCWSPPCSSRSCCQRSPGSPAHRSRSSCVSRSGWRAARSCATAAGRR